MALKKQNLTPLWVGSVLDDMLKRPDPIILRPSDTCAWYLCTSKTPHPKWQVRDPTSRRVGHGLMSSGDSCFQLPPPLSFAPNSVSIDPASSWIDSYYHYSLHRYRSVAVLTPPRRPPTDRYPRTVGRPFVYAQTHANWPQGALVSCEASSWQSLLAA